MAAYLLDSSAVVKCHTLELGTGWMLDLVEPGRSHELFVAAVTPVEVAAALYRRVGARSLSAAQAAEGVRDLRRDLARTYRVVELTPEVVEEAIAAAEKHALRGYDCVQLASLVHIEALRRASGLSSICLVSADAELIVAARAEDMATENPNDHPSGGET